MYRNDYALTSAVLVFSRPHPASPSFSLSLLPALLARSRNDGEGAVLHLLHDLHNYYINPGSLLSTFEEFLFYQTL